MVVYNASAIKQFFKPNRPRPVHRPASWRRPPDAFEKMPTQDPAHAEEANSELSERDEVRRMMLQRARSSRAASLLLWSRITELETLHNKLAHLGELVAEVVRLHEDIVARVDAQMAVVLDCATSADEGRQNVDLKFGEVLNGVIEQLHESATE
jgi:hypothetical protein